MQFLADYCVVFPVFSWFVGGMTGLLLVWMWCGWFVDGLAGLWVVCWWFSWFVGSLGGFWVVYSWVTANETFSIKKEP